MTDAQHYAQRAEFLAKCRGEARRKQKQRALRKQRKKRKHSRRRNPKEDH